MFLQQLEELGKALFNFSTITDLEQWLSSRPKLVESRVKSTTRTLGVIALGDRYSEAPNPGIAPLVLGRDYITNYPVRMC